MDFFERDGDEWLLETCLINALMSCGGTPCVRILILLFYVGTLCIICVLCSSKEKLEIVSHLGAVNVL